MARNWSGRDRARYLTVRLPIPPADPDGRLAPHPALPLWSISEDNVSKPSFPCPELHGCSPLYSSRVRSVPLLRIVPKGEGPSPSGHILAYTAVPCSASSTPAASPERHWLFLGLSPSYFHQPFPPPSGLPGSHGMTQSRGCRGRVSACPVRALRLPRMFAG